MLKQYLKLILRQLKRDQLFSIINISGLAIGLAFAFIILLFVITELTFDKPHKKGDRVYRVVTNHITFGNWKMPMGCYPLKDVLDEEVPQIEKSARSISINRFKIHSNNQYLDEDRLLGVDPEIFDILSIPLKYGDYKSALSDPQQIMLSESMAQKYFSNKNPIGESFQVFIKDTIFEFKVHSIFKDIPINSSFQANFMVNIKLASDMSARGFFTIGGSGKTTGESYRNSWRYNFTPIWFLINNETDIEEAQEAMQLAANKHLPKSLEVEYIAQHLKDIHFCSDEYRLDKNAISGNKTYIKIYASITLLILLLVSINYIILSIAKSTKRSKEIGIRKVSGADKKGIIKLILGESVGISILTLPLAITLAELIIPLINRSLGLKLEFHYIENWLFTVTALCLTIIIGIISGSYLALYLSRFSPMSILREHHSKGKSISRVRKGLIIFQTSIFILLLFSSFIIQKQFHHIHNMPIGFNKENLYCINLNDEKVVQNYNAFRNDLRSIPGIKHVAGALHCPPSGFSLGQTITHPHDPERTVNLEGNIVDFGFFEAYEFEFIEGTHFSEDKHSNKNTVILNQTAVEKLELEDPIGETVSGREVIGVIKDFQVHSALNKMEPIMIYRGTSNIREVIIKLNSKKTEDLSNQIKDVWEKYAEVNALEMSSIDDMIKVRHAEEYKFKAIINGFTVLAIILASMGLFGSCLYMAEQKSKEIGIRKVFGSKNIQVLNLINAEFIKYSLYAMILALPVGFYVMREWLTNFAYKIQLTPMEFIISAIISVSIVILTISYIAIKYARANPVDSIRYE